MRPLLLTVLATLLALGSGCSVLRPKPKVPVYNDATGKVTMETTGKLRERAKPATTATVTPPAVRPVAPPVVTSTATAVSAPLPGRTGQTARTAYRLRANDPIIIFLRDLPNNRDQQIEDIIDDQGSVNLPYLGRMTAAGKTTTEFEQEIEEKYVKDQIYRRITVNVVMPQQFIFVDGEVKSPNRYQLVAGMTLLQAVSAAAGTTEFANPEKVQLIRGGSNTIYNIRELRKTPEKDPPLEAGDRIFVPESRY
jgi:polysaccharide export outer membrane protein